MARQIKAGTTDVSVTIRIVDSTDGTPETGVTSATSGLDLEYRREGAVSTDITESDLSALTDAHSDGGMLHIGNGYYRLDLPDAACAAGATGVLIHGTVTSMVVIGEYIELVAYDPYDAARLGLTSLPNANPAANGGLPTVDASNRIVGFQGTLNTLDDLDAAQDSQHATTQSKVDTAQADLNLLTGTDGATLATSQPNYAPAKAGNQMDLVNAPNNTALTAIGAKVEAMVLDEGDATALLAAISAKVEEFLINEGDATATLAAISAAVVSALGTGSGLTSLATTGEAAAAIAAYDPPTRAEATADKQEILDSVPKLILRTTVASVIDNMTFILTDGSPDNNTYFDCLVLVQDAATTLQRSFAVVGSYSAATKRLELTDDYGLTFTVAPGDIIEIYPTSILNATMVPLSLGMASGNLDTQLAGINTNIDSAESAIRGADSDTLKTLSDQLDGLPSAAANADAVWDEAIAGHLSAGSTGAALNAAGSAGDPWSTPIPGAYGAGTAGKLIGDEFQGELDAIKAKTDLISAGGALTIVSPVSPDGDSLTIYANDDYLLAQKIAFTIPGGLWPDLTGQSVWLGIGENKELNAPLLLQAGTVDSGSASADQEISFSIDGDNVPSSKFFAGADLGFSIKAVYTSPAIGEKTIGSGRARVLRDFVGRAPT